MAEFLSLKWGTLKACTVETEKSHAALRRYADFGISGGGAMTQRDSEQQRGALLDLIDAVDSETIWLDWDGIEVSKEDAKKYVIDYGKPDA